MTQRLSFSKVFRVPWCCLLVAGTLIGASVGHGQGSSKNIALAKDGVRQKWALLVGVNKYNELNALTYCHEDVQALGQRLVKAGFPAGNVFLLTSDAKEMKYLPFKTNIERQLELVSTMAGEEDLVVVAFSGHGTHLDGASYLCPAEARLEAPKATMVSLDMVYQRLVRCKAKWKLLLVDACRNDPRPPGMKDAGNHEKGAGDFARSFEKPPQGILALTSCAPGEVSMEAEELRHGVFMNFLLEGLSGKADRDGGNSDGQVSLLELYRYTNTQTKRYVVRKYNRGQTPTLRGEIPEDYDISSAATDPTVVAAMAQGDECYANYRHDEAIAAYNRAVELDPRYIPAYDSRGKTRYRQRNYQGAILDHTLAIQLGPKAISLAYRSRAYAAAKEFDKALVDADEAIRLDQACAEAHSSRGVVLLVLKRTAEALTEHNEAIRLAPNYAAAYNSRGNAYESQQESSKAIADYDQAIRLAPKYAIAYNNRGNAYRNLRDYTRAMADYDQAIRIDPKYVGAYYNRGNAYRDQREFSKAVADYSEVIRLDPKSAATYCNRGTAYAGLQDAAKAMADYDEAIRLDPKSAIAYNNRGNLHRRRQDYAKAIADLDEAIRLDPKYAGAYHLRSAVYLEKTDYPKAIADLNEAIRLTPTNPLYYSMRAKAYRAQGRTAEAQADERKANELPRASRNSGFRTQRGP